MTEYDQERLSELAEELDRAKEKIRCLEADLRHVGRRWLIWSNEHNAWWRPNSQGYTPNRDEAGRYSFNEALQITNDANIRLKNAPYEAMVPDETQQ